jgi:hypothetical protein
VAWRTDNGNRAAAVSTRTALVEARIPAPALAVNNTRLMPIALSSAIRSRRDIRERDPTTRRSTNNNTPLALAPTSTFIPLKSCERAIVNRRACRPVVDARGYPHTAG